MATTNTVSACEKALSLPEILAEIFHWILADKEGLEVRGHEDEDGNCETKKYKRKDTLFCCTLVSRLWFAESISFLWKVPPSPDLTHLRCNVEDRLKPIIDPTRQAFYAKFIEEATIEARSPRDDPSSLDGITLPGLRSLRLRVPLGGDVVPGIIAPQVKVLEIDPQVEIYPEEWVGEENMGRVLDQILELFPNLEEVRFCDACYVRRMDWERFQKQLPRAMFWEEDEPFIVSGGAPWG